MYLIIGGETYYPAIQLDDVSDESLLRRLRHTGAIIVFRDWSCPKCGEESPSIPRYVDVALCGCCGCALKNRFAEVSEPVEVHAGRPEETTHDEKYDLGTLAKGFLSRLTGQKSPNDKT